MLETGDFLQRLQRAVARVAKGRRFRVPEVRRIRKEDFLLARLDVFAASPGSLVMHVQPHMEPASHGEDELPLGGTTWGEVGLVDLLRALPEHETDDGAVDAITAGPPVLRRAVADLVLARGMEALDIGFRLQRPSGDEIVSRLAPEHVRTLRRSLSVPTVERSVETRVGVLDGVRTRRRLFYFQPQGEVEIHGLVDEELLPAVRDNLDRRVVAVLEVVTTRSRAGQRGQRSYRLLQVQAAQQHEITTEILRRLSSSPRELPPGTGEEERS